MQSTCAILYCHMCWPAVTYFSTLSQNWDDFKKNKVTENKICVLNFCTTFLWHIYLSQKNISDITINVRRSSCKVLVILVRFYWILNLLDRFSKDYQMLNFMKIRPVWTEMFHAGGGADGRRDIPKLIVAFWNVANAPNTVRGALLF